MKSDFTLTVSYLNSVFNKGILNSWEAEGHRVISVLGLLVKCFYPFLNKAYYHYYYERKYKVEMTDD